MPSGLRRDSARYQSAIAPSPHPDEPRQLCSAWASRETVHVVPAMVQHLDARHLMPV